MSITQGVITPVVFEIRFPEVMNNCTGKLWKYIDFLGCITATLFMAGIIGILLITSCMKPVLLLAG